MLLKPTSGGLQWGWANAWGHEGPPIQSGRGLEGELDEVLEQGWCVGVLYEWPLKQHRERGD